MKIKRRGEDGFTLLEVIISVVILSMIAGALTAAFVTAMGGTGSTSQRIHETSDAQVIASFLERDAQAAGGSNPSTGASDPSLGVSAPPSADDAGCTNTTPGATLEFRFKWNDQTGTTPAVANVANYYFVASTKQLVRTTCVGAATPANAKSITLATSILSVAPSCSPGSCPPHPDTVSLTITEQDSANAGTYTFTLTAELRPESQTAAGVTNASPAPLLILGRSGCGGTDNTTGLSVANSAFATLNVRGNSYVNAVDNGCHAMNLSGGFLNTFNTSQASILNGGTCTGSCPAITSYTPALGDPFAGLAPPSTAGLPVFSTTTCSGTLSPGVYTNTLTDSNLFGSCVLNAGIYILKGGISITNGASLSSNGGVLLYMPPPSAGGSPTATFDGTATGGINLTGMTSGPYAGLAIWQAGTTTVQFGATFFGFNNVSINGTIYAPVAQVKNTVSVLFATVSVSGIVAQTLVVNFSIASTMNIGIPLTITTSSLPQWTVNQPGYSATLAAAGGSTPYTWSQSGLPAGLSLNSSTGVISGKPTSSGTANVNVTVTDSTGSSTSAPLSLVINPPVSIATAIPDWTVTFTYFGVAMSTNNTGTAPYTWTASGLPDGLSISPAGLITGSPTRIATFTPSVTVTDATGATVTRNYTVHINQVPTIFPPVTMPSPWTSGNPYPATTVLVANGTAPFTWTASGLPTSLTLSSNGTISGTPSVAGTFSSVSITATDSAGAAATVTYSITVNSPLGVVSGAPPKGEQGIPYNFTVVPTGGTPPYTLTATGLPAPLTMSTAGAISGTPTAPSTTTVVVTVKDSTGAITTKTYTLTIAAPVSFSGSLPNWTAGGDYGAVALSGANGVAPYTWSQTGLPAGLSLNPGTGVVTGTPNTTGTTSVNVTIHDSFGATQTQTFSVTINAPPMIATGSLPTGERTVAYSGVTLTLQPGTGTAPLTWSAPGLLASGLTLNTSTGVISGTPTAGGSFPVTITVVDHAGASTSKPFTLIIAQAPTVSATTFPQWTVNLPNYPGPLLTGSGGTAPYTFTSTALPAGLTLSSGGAIAGTPTAAGTTNFTVTIHDSLGATATQNDSITINAAPAITTPSLPNGYLNVAYEHDARRVGRYAVAHLVGHGPASRLVDLVHGRHLGHADCNRNVDRGVHAHRRDRRDGQRESAAHDRPTAHDQQRRAYQRRRKCRQGRAGRQDHCRVLVDDEGRQLLLGVEWRRCQQPVADGERRRDRHPQQRCRSGQRLDHRHQRHVHVQLRVDRPRLGRIRHRQQRDVQGQRTATKSTINWTANTHTRSRSRSRPGTGTTRPSCRARRSTRHPRRSPTAPAEP